MTVYYTYAVNLTALTKARAAAVGANFTAVQTSFALVDTDMQLRATAISPALTGVPTAPTAAPNNNSTQIATTAYVDTADALEIAARTAADALEIAARTAADALKANIASPALTGTPTAPTATTGTATTQLATTAFVGATAFSAALPSQTGNSGKFVTTNGTVATWAVLPVSPKIFYAMGA